MFGELNKAMSGIKLFAVADEVDFGDCALLVDVVVVVVTEGDELSELKRDANLLWKEDMTKKIFFLQRIRRVCLIVRTKEKREREKEKERDKKQGGVLRFINNTNCTAKCTTMIVIQQKREITFFESTGH